MTSKELIDAFETLADAPNGVVRLRELILQLAVRGKLVPQDQHEEPARDLLERIAGEKARLIDEQKMKNPKGPPPLDLGATPFKLPPGWEWVRLVDAGFVVMGNSPPGDSYNESGDGVPLINGPVEFSRGHFGPTVKSKFTTAPNQMCIKGDLLVCVRGATTGRTNIAAFDACIGRGVALVRTFHAQPYTNIFMWYVGQELLAAGKGTTFPSISYVDLAGKPFPCPPLAEQGRIVARVDELMALLDRLEAAQGSREATRQALRDAALSALRDADDPENVQSAWSRIADHMGSLLSDPADVAPLRQTILHLAVRGRLVPQDAGDGPASELLKQLVVEKAELVEEGKIKKPKHLPPIEAGEVPFDLPQGWLWSRLQDIGDWGAGATPRRGESRYYGGAINWFKSGELPDGPMAVPSVEQITPDALRECSLREDQPGDVLIAMYGATIGKLGILEVPGTTNQAVCACTCHGEFYNRYLFIFLAAWRQHFIGSGEGGAQPNISKVKIESTLAPIPPAAEQHRIVAKVDELMAHCDDLEDYLQRARETRATFAASAVASVA